MLVSKTQKKFFSTGWVLTFGVWLVYLVSQGVPMYAGATIHTQMVLQEGLDDSFIGISSALAGVVRAAVSAAGGYLILRIGACKLLLLGSCTICISSIILGLFPLSAQLRIIIFSLMGVGMVYGAVVTVPVLIHTWFGKKSSLHMAVALTAGSISGMILTPLAEISSVQWGWRSGWLMCAACGAIAVLIAWLLIKFSPPDASHAVQSGTPSFSRETPQSHEQRLSRNPIFYVLAFSWAMRNLIYMVSVSYLSMYVVQQGFGTAKGASAIFSMTAAGLAGRVLIGILAQRRAPLYVLASFSTTSVAMGAGFLCFSSGYILILVAAGLIGFGYGAGFVLNPLLSAYYFPSCQYPIVVGLLGTAGGISGAIGPLFAMILIQQFGYSSAFFIPALLCALCALSNFYLRHYSNQ